MTQERRDNSRQQRRGPAPMGSTGSQPALHNSPPTNTLKAPAEWLRLFRGLRSAQPNDGIDTSASIFRAGYA